MSIQTAEQRRDALLGLRSRIDAEVARVVCGPDRQFYARAAVLAAAAFHISPVDIFGPARHAEIVDARHIVYYLARATGESYPRIGRAMSRDHTTILSGCRRVEQDGRLRAIAAGIGERMGTTP
jgi:hypothetical protein